MGAPARTRILVLTISCALSSAACSGSNGDRPGSPDTQRAVVVGMTTPPTTFDVHGVDGDTAETRALIGTVWPSAYRVRPDFSVEPWLLSGEAVIASTDPFIVEWRIRPDANWSDGTPVTVADFEALYRRCSGRAPGGACVDAAGYGEITRFEKVDDKTLRTRFRRPYVEFPSLFRDIPPSHTLPDGADGPAWARRFRTDPGPSAGPYRFVSMTPEDGVVLERNPDYFGEPAVIERVVVSFLPAADQIGALRTGRVDVVFPDPTLDLVQDLETMSDVAAQVAPGARMERLVFNLASGALGDAAVRRAVAFSLDRDGLVRALVAPLLGDARRLDNRAYGVGQAPYEAHGEEFGARDVARAHAELAAAGFVRGADGIYERGGARLEFRISTTSGDARREQALQLIQAQLAEAGIGVRIDNADEAVMAGRLEAGDFDLALVGRRAGPFPAAALAALYGTDGALNVGGFRDEQADELATMAEAEPDATARAALVNELDRRLWEVLPDVPLYQPPSVVAHHRDVSGPAPNPTTQGPLWNVETWRIAAGAVVSS